MEQRQPRSGAKQRRRNPTGDPVGVRPGTLYPTLKRFFGIKSRHVGKDRMQAIRQAKHQTTTQIRPHSMRSDSNHSNEHDTSTAAESSQLATSFPAPTRLARPSLRRNSGIGAALLAPGAALITGASRSLAANGNQNENDVLTRGDVAILQLLAAAELIEADLWQQYNELGGVKAAASGYTAGLEILDGDQPQYISDNTDDELSHAAFLNAYLKSKGEQQVDLRQFARLEPSQVSFVPQTGRLTDLKQLSVDTSWWTRYRSTR